MNDNVAIVVDFRVQGAGAQVITAHLQLIQQASEKAARDSSAAFNTYFGANFFADLGARFISGFVDKVKSGISEIVLYAARTHELQISLEALGKANNFSNAALNEQVQALRAVNIQTQAATQVLSQFVAAGLPLAKATPLANVAKDLAVIAGMNTQDEFKSLIDGITTLQTRVLRNAGVFIRIEEVTKRYADTLHKTTDDLSEQEKQQAVLNAVIEFGSRVAGTYDAAMGSASKQIRSFTRVQQDFSDAVGSKLEPALLLGVKGATLLVEGLTKVPSAVIGVATAIAALTLAVTIYNTKAIFASIPLLASFVKGLKDVVFWMINFRTALEETQLAITATAGWIGLIALLAGVVIALVQLSKEEEKAVDISQARIDSVIAERDALNTQSQSLGELTNQTILTNQQQTALTEQYKALNFESQDRIGNINDEANAAQKLQSEIQRLIQLRTEELELMARIATAQLIGKIQELHQTEQEAEAARTGLAALGDRRTALEQEVANLKKQNQYLVGGQLREAEGTLTAVNRIIDGQTKSAQALTEKTGNLRREAGDLAAKQSALGGALGQTSDQLVDQAAKFGTVRGEVDAGKKLINDFRTEQELLTPAIQANVSALDKFTLALDGINDAVEKQIADRRKRINALINTAAETAAQTGQPQNAGKLAQGIVDFDTTGQLKHDLEVERAYKVAREAVDKQYGLSKERHQKQLSELEQLQKKIRELEKDLIGFRDLSAPEFTLRFRQEGLTRQIRDLEHILDLRREIGIALNTPLPAPLREALGRDDERAASLARQYADELQRQVDRKNAIKKLTEEQRDAEEELARAIIALQVPVVDAQTRAHLQYVKNVRERENLEKDLTAEIAVEVRKRAEAEQHAARDIQQAQAEAFKDRVAAQNKAREDLMRAVARAAVQQSADPNDAFRGNLLIGLGRDIAGGLSANPQIAAVQEGNKLLKQIETNTSFLNPQKSSASSSSPVDIRGEFATVNSRFGMRGGRPHTGLDLAASRRGVPGEFVGQPFAQGRVISAAPAGDYGNMVAVEDMASGMVARFAHLNNILANVGDVLERGGTVGTLGATGNARGAHIHYELRVGGRAVNPAKYPNIRPLKVGGVGGVLSAAQQLSQGLQSAQEGATQVDPVASMERLLAEYEGARTRNASRLNAFNAQVKGVSGFTLDELEQQKNGLELIAAATAEINRQTDRRAQIAQEAANIEIESREANLKLLKQDAIAEDELAERRELQIAGVVDLARAQANLNRLRDPSSVAYQLELQRAEIDNVKELATQERALIRLRDQAARGYLNDPSFRARAQNDAEVSRLRAAESRAAQIVQLEDRIAHAGEDAADRYRIAWLSAIAEIRDADIKAIEEQIAAAVKLADASTLHVEQVRAQVAKHLASQKTITETTGDAIIKIYDRIADRMDATVDKAFGKLGFAGSLIGDFVKTAGRQILNNIFGRVLGLPNAAQGANGQVRAAQTQTMNVQAGTVIIAGGGGAGGVFGGGGGAQGGGGILQRLLGGFGGGGRATGTPPFIEGGSFTVGGGSPFSGNLFGGNAPTTPAAQTGGGGILNRLFGQGSGLRSFFGQNLGNGQFGGLFAKGSFGFGNSAFASALPLLGASLGSSIGGGQGLGGILGMAGGALAGIGLIAPSALGLSATSALAPLFSNPITAAIGGALLVGAYFVGRSMKRRKEETARDQLTRDSRSAIQQLIRKVETDQMDGEGALTQAAQIREQYLQNANQLTDRKTRDNAIATVRELDYDIANLQRAVEAQAKRQELLQKMIPTFAEGGRFTPPRGIPRGTQAAGYRYGLVGNKLTFGGVDEYVGMFREGEAFLTIENINALGGAPAMRRAGVRGFDGGGRTGAGSVAPPSRASSPQASGRPIMVVPVIVANEAIADAMVAASNEDIIAQKVIAHVQRNGANGVAGVVATEIFRR